MNSSLFSSGRILPDQEVLIVESETCQPSSDGEVGEIRIMSSQFVLKGGVRLGMHVDDVVAAKDLKIQEMGKELNVGTVLEGSVRRTAERARITAKLIEVASQTQVWADSWDRGLSDLLDKAFEESRRN